MIDTIALSIQQESFEITDHNKFNPSTENLYKPNYYRLGNRSNISCVQNPTKKELTEGIYKPRLKVTKRMKKGSFEIVLRIEFSIPKLLYGNNFDEIEDHDFQKIIEILREKLLEMGVVVSKETLINADVSAVHFSKNFILSDYLTPYSIMKEISKINVNRQLDLNKTDFRNEGHCLKFRANNFEVVFYDKKKDLEKSKISEKRAEEKENGMQQSLFLKQIKNNPSEILRMEVRINNRTKLKKIFKDLNLLQCLSFSSICLKENSQKVLIYYFDKIYKAYTSVISIKKSCKDYLFEIKKKNPKIKLRKAVFFLGLAMALEEFGCREFREFSKIFNFKYWDRMVKEYKEMGVFGTSSDIFKPIRKSFDEFKSLKMSDIVQ